MLGDAEAIEDCGVAAGRKETCSRANIGCGNARNLLQCLRRVLGILDEGFPLLEVVLIAARCDEASVD